MRSSLAAKASSGVSSVGSGGSGGIEHAFSRPGKVQHGKDMLFVAQDDDNRTVIGRYCAACATSAGQGAPKVDHRDDFAAQFQRAIWPVTFSDNSTCSVTPKADLTIRTGLPVRSTIGL